MTSELAVEAGVYGAEMHAELTRLRSVCGEMAKAATPFIKLADKITLASGHDCIPMDSSLSMDDLWNLQIAVAALSSYNAAKVK